MGLTQSKDEQLYQQVNYGNVEGIKSLHREGASLEYADREGKTPLIAACLNPQLYNVAKTLIELGANVNAYRPGRLGGTPLHHAAKRGLVQTVKLLLSNGANALLVNDDCQTALDVARAKGYSNIVRAIEGHICLFSGWMRELYGPGFLELLAPQLLSRKVWVVIYPCGSRNLQKPFKLELAVYSGLQDAQPRMTIALWKASLEEPAFHQPDLAVVVTETSTKQRIKLASLIENDKPQLQHFCDACKGIPQVMHSNFPFNDPSSAVVLATAPPSSEDVELAMALSASLQTAVQEGITPLNQIESTSGASSSACPTPAPGLKNHNGSASSLPTGVVQVPPPPPPADSAPSAPAATTEVMGDNGVHYPTIDYGPVDAQTGKLVNTSVEIEKKEGAEGSSSSSCVVCLDAPVEGACVPCGHMAGCMSCLSEIKEKKWGCPICRAHLDQVIRVYAV